MKTNRIMMLPWLIFAATFIGFSIFVDYFFTFNNLMLILNISTSIAIPAIGLAIVMVAGSFDLSFVGVIGVVSVFSIKMLEAGFPLGLVLIVAFVLSIAMEMVNAYFIIGLEIHPWLTTIGTMLVYVGLEKALSKGHNLGLYHPFFTTIQNSKVLGVPSLVIILLCIAGLMTVIMHRSTIGMRLYSVGGNYNAVQKAGVNADFYRYLSFLIMGIICWLSAIVYLTILTGYTMEAAYVNQLEIILAVFFGMAISRKNIRNVPGAILGAVFVAFLANGLGLTGLSSYWIKMIEGILIIIVILGNSVGRKELVHLH